MSKVMFMLVLLKKRGGYGKITFYDFGKLKLKVTQCGTSKYSVVRDYPDEGVSLWVDVVKAAFSSFHP